MSVVRIRESSYYGGFFLRKIDANFVGTLETVRNRETIKTYYSLHLHLSKSQTGKLVSSKINQKENTLHFSFDLFSFK